MGLRVGKPLQEREDLVSRLRAETATEHASIERALDLPVMLSSVQRYREILARFHGFFAAVEPRLEAVLTDAGFYPARRKLPLLQQDLLELGVAHGELAGLPVCGASVPASSRHEALGVLYVLEGATLGGAIISKEIRHRFGDAAPENYFSAYGAHRGLMWRTFKARLAEEEGPDDDRIIDAAKQSFQVLEAWLMT